MHHPVSKQIGGTYRMATKPWSMGLCPFLFFFLNTFIIYLFIYLLAVLGLRFCARAFSSCGKRGPLSSSRCAGLSLSWPLLLRSTGSRRAGSAVVAHGPSCSAACGILPDQGSNPCALHWQADSQPLRHQGSPLPLSEGGAPRNSTEDAAGGLRSGRGCLK